MAHRATPAYVAANHMPGGICGRQRPQRARNHDPGESCEGSRLQPKYLEDRPNLMDSQVLENNVKEEYPHGHPLGSLLDPKPPSAPVTNLCVHGINCRDVCGVTFLVDFHSSRCTCSTMCLERSTLLQVIYQKFPAVSDLPLYMKTSDIYHSC